MSFALTTQQVREQTKTVTRRLGWQFLKVGDVVQPVLKCQGLKPGESIQKIGGPISIVDVRREPLKAIIDDPAYGSDEVFAEGFQMLPESFVEMFCQHMRPCQPWWTVTRIEFAYEEATATNAVDPSADVMESGPRA